jgi:hypothetical protein
MKTTMIHSPMIRTRRARKEKEGVLRKEECAPTMIPQKEMFSEDRELNCVASIYLLLLTIKLKVSYCDY